MTAAWAVVRAQPHQEEAAAAALRRMGYRVYLPWHRRYLSPHGRANGYEPSMAPYWPGYLFAHDWRGWPRDRFSSAIIGLAKFGSEHATVSDDDIAAIRAAENAGAFDDPDPRKPARRSDLAVGDLVTVERQDRAITGRIVGLSDSGSAILRCLESGMRLTVPAEGLQFTA